MANHVLLNNIDHKDLRVDTGHGGHLGDDMMFAPVIAAEFRNVQAHYPIVFRKDPEGRFQAVALFGFREGQNLFLRGVHWEATYLPLSVERQPFLIGLSGEQLLVHIDLDHPRVGRQSGEPLFLAHGGTTGFLEKKNSTLLALHEGLQSMPTFIATLLEHELLESFVLDVTLDDGSQNRLVGFYAINEDRLRLLPGATVAALHQAGYLEPVYMAVASLANLRVMIDKMNQADAGTR